VNIALLSVGTEILLGDTINTNLASLGQALYNNGFILSSEKTVPDDKKLNFEIWYDKKKALIIKVAYKRMGLWEYRLKKIQ